MRAAACVPLLCVLILINCGDDQSPAVGTPEYEAAVAAFHTGVAAIQVGEDARATEALTRFVALAPAEPAGPANLALLAFQQRRLDEADSLTSEALQRAPGDPRIRMLAALTARAQGRLDEAIDHLRQVAGTSGDAARASYLLVQTLEERGSPADAAESRAILDRLVAADSTSVWLQVVSARHAARHGDTAVLERAVASLERLSAVWPAQDRAALERVRQAVTRPTDAGIELATLAASLESLPGYGVERDAVAITEQQPDLVTTEFILLTRSRAQPSAPDTGLEFVVNATIGSPSAVQDVQPVWSGESGPTLAILASDGVWLASDTGVVGRAPLPAGADLPGDASVLAPIDFDRDFRIDLAVAAAGRLDLFRQDTTGAFHPLEAAIPAATRARFVNAAWAADTDLDGDMDLVIGVRGSAPLVLRNRGDGTFEELSRFDGVADVRAFVWGDLDDDGVPDATFVDADGVVHVFSNPRQDRPSFLRLNVPADGRAVRAVALGDMDADGRFDLTVLHDDGAVAVWSPSAAAWQTRDVASWPGLPEAGPVRLLVADLDNNGALDLAASTDATHIWLADATYSLQSLTTLPVTVTAATDAGGSGRIELVGIGADGRAVRVTGRGSVEYYGLTIIARSTDQPGDGRINSFGIGGEAEIRTGLLYQKRSIEGPAVHFGIGPNTGVTVARILWPNGTAQAEFDLLASQGAPMVAEQRLKGSCPWLFAFDGEAMRFITDVAWRSALGLRINAYGSSTVIHSQDRVRVAGEQLAMIDGYYEMRVTAELWESHFFDHVSLMVIDHSADTDVFIDERFMLPPPDTAPRITDRLSPIAGARDQSGRDVLPLIEVRDERYVDTFELGDYQGLARSEHFIEVDLGPDVPADEPLLLVAHGWVQPTDGSINFALGQGDLPAPRGLRVEVPDGRGGWRVLHADLGMPAGKTKTVLIDLAGAFGADGPRRVRLLTNMEIYWDHMAWTRSRSADNVRVTRVLPEVADLRYRGFSRVRRAGRRAPELPEYDTVTGTAPQWADLEGLHTRFGDVRPLLEHVDDRFVIMNAGDEMVLRFPAPPEPADGAVRDFVFVSDAWVKDGDFNNGFSSTLRPLPHHGLTDYSRAPGRLADDPAFLLHPEDWRDYHTRYVTPTRFRHALSGN